jgi:hypothetical protein
MKKKVVARIAAIGALVVLVAGPVPMGADADVPDVFESSAVAGGLHASLAVPAYFEVFGPYAFAEATNGSSHSYEAPGYGGFFLTAAAEQFGFPPPPGTTETLYPQGPRSAGTPGTPTDANVFSSSGRSGPNGASGRSVVARGAFAPAFDVGLGQAAASVLADATGVTATSAIAMQDVELADGLVSIDQVTGTARSRATGRSTGSDADGSIAMTGLRVGDVPIDLRADGIVIAGTPYTAPDGGVPIDDFLAQAGVKIERLPDSKRVSEDGEVAEFAVGGIRFTFSQPAAEFAFTVTMGDLVARARALDLPEPEPAPVPAVDAPPIAPPAAPIVDRSVRGGGGVVDGSPIMPSDVVRRRVVRTTSADGADWILISAFAALAAPMSLIVRRAFRAAARP